MQSLSAQMKPANGVSGLATNVLWSLLSHIFSRGSLMLSAIILARSLDTAAFAAYSYFQLTISMLSAYAAMGLGITSSRYFSEIGHEHTNREPFPLGTLWCLSILLALLAFFGLILIPEKWLSAGLAVPKWLVAMGVLVLTLQIVPGGAILGLEKYRQSTLISLFSGSVMIVGTVIASRWNSSGVAMGALICSVLLQALGEAVIVVRSVRWQRLLFGLRNTAANLRRVLDFAGPMLVVSLTAASGSWLLGRLILQQADGTAAFAMYSIGLQWFAFGLLLPGMVSGVLLPRLVRNAVEGAEGKRILVWRGALLALTASATAALIGILLAPEIMALYGRRAEGSRWFLGSYLIAAVLSAPANTIGNAIVASEGQRQWLAITIVWLSALILIAHALASHEALSGSTALAGAAIIHTALAIITAKYRGLI